MDTVRIRRRSCCTSLAALLAVTTAAGDARGAGRLLFGTPRFEAGNEAIAIAQADLNGDLAIDLVVANRIDNQVTVLINEGDGVLVDGGSFAVGTAPVSVATADLNGDSKVDLAVADYGSDSVSILVNLGDGTFAAAVQYPVGNGPHSVAIGDVNGDIYPDLATANLLGDSVSVLINDGDGTYSEQVAYVTDLLPRGVAIEDLNGDQRGDLAVACRSPFTEAPGTAAVHLNNGDGTFAPRVAYTADLAPSAVAAGDLNGDGFADLAVLNEGTSFTGYASQVSVYLNTGDGTFADAVGYAAGTGGWAIALGDLDDDDDLDIAAADAEFSEGYGQYVRILSNDGDGSFASPVRYRAGTVPSGVTMAEFDGDGKLDLAVASFGGTSGGNQDSGVTVMLGRGDGTFASNATDSVGGAPLDGVIGDLNRDGELDLAVVNRDVQVIDDLAVLFGNGDGSFSPYEGYDLPSSPNSLASGDFDGDGWDDLVSSSSRFTGVVQIMFNNGDGTYADEIQYFIDAEDPSEVEVADINADDYDDIVVVNYGVYSGVEPGSVSVILSNGDGTFAPEENHVVGGHPWYLALGDLDGDDDVDIAVSADELYVLLNEGDGTFAPPASYAVGVNPRDVTIADLNGDAAPDLVVANAGSDDVAVLLNLGGTFAPAVFYPVGYYPQSATAVDLDGDDDLDLVASTHYCASVLLNDGSGTLGDRIDYVAGASHNVALAGDLDHDCDLDVPMVGWNNRNVVVLLNRRFDPACLGDFDHDDDIDLVDFATLQAGFGTASGASYEDGDLDRDGDVDLDDFAGFAINFGGPQ